MIGCLSATSQHFSHLEQMWSVGVQLRHIFTQNLAPFATLAAKDALGVFRSIPRLLQDGLTITCCHYRNTEGRNSSRLERVPGKLSVS